MVPPILVVSGIFWLLAYVLMIRRGFLDKTYGMPLVALCANISWEFIYSFILPHPRPQLYINIAWFALDTVILFQVIRFWKREFPDLSAGQFFPTFLFTLGSGFCLVLFSSIDLDDPIGKYAAFGQNLMMSALFIVMLYRRDDLRGQSIYIAAAKMIGTFFASWGFYPFFPFPDNLLLPFLFAATLVLDLVYMVMIYERCRKLNIAPWFRF